MINNKLRALLFDVFGTVVDWRSSIINEGEKFNLDENQNVNWALFADKWRSMYQPAMEKVRNGSRSWTILDVLHRESLDLLISEFDLGYLDEDQRLHLNQVWHRLQPWPDSVAGLNRLKTKFIIAPLSNGNVSLLTNMAKHSNLNWDAILGAEVAGHYKPQPAAYLTAARLLGLSPDQCMMVAAHNDDLQAARCLGFTTAFIARPLEYGPNQKKDLTAESDWDFICTSIEELAELLKC